MADRMTRDELHDAIRALAEQFSGELGLAAINVDTGEAVEWNADALFPTASVIKLAVLVEVYRQAAREELKLQRRMELRADEIVGGSGILKVLGPGLNPTVRDVATLMVVLSDNTATNMLIDLVGGVPAVNRTIHDDLGLPSIVLHNRIDFARIGSDVRRLAESSARDMATLVAMLARGEVVDAASSAAMISIMRRQQYLDQAPRYLAYSPYAVELGIEQPLEFAGKTGFFPGTRVDAGVLMMPGETTVAFCLMNHGSTDATIAAESEGAVLNGLLGRLLVEYWWPGAEIPAGLLLDSPYIGAGQARA